MTEPVDSTGGLAPLVPAALAVPGKHSLRLHPRAAESVGSGGIGRASPGKDCSCSEGGGSLLRPASESSTGRMKDCRRVLP